MKKIIITCLSLLTVLILSTSVSADAYTEPYTDELFTYDDALYGVVFDSVEKLTSFLSQDIIEIGFGRLEREWCIGVSSIKVPKMYNDDKTIKKIELTPNGIYVTFKTKTGSFDLYYSHLNIGSKTSYNCTADLYNEPESRERLDIQKHISNNGIIYYITNPESKYLFKQDDIYYELYVWNENTFSEKYLTLCDITELPLNIKPGWHEIEGYKCYRDKNGKAVTKPTVIDGVLYAFSKNGVCKGTYTGFANTSKGRRYYKNGVPYKNKHFKTKSGKSYCTDKNGYLLTGWHIIKKYEPYHWFDKNGVEAIGNTNIEGIEYYFDDKGCWASDPRDQIEAYLEANIPKECFGGFRFADFTSELIIKVTDIDAVKIPEFYPKMRVEECKFTLEQLEMTWNIIEENSYQFSYAHMTGGVDVLNNQVDVEVYEIHDDLVAFIDSLEYGECVKLCENPPVLDD